MAISSAFAGGDIAPVEPAVAAPVASSTTVDGKLVAYYYSDDAFGASSLFDGDSSMLGTAVTLNVTHKFNDMFTANFGAVGYANVLENSAMGYYFEGDPETGGFFNVANLTATFGDTTLVVGRQLLNTPMLTGFDWLLAPGSFEAVTLVNSSIDNVTLVASYVNKWRDVSDLVFGDGDEFYQLDGDNWAVGAVYSNGFDASIWYYNVDAYGEFVPGAEYTQVYLDAGTTLSSVDVAAQYVNTDYDALTDSTAYGLKVSGKVSDVTLTAAYNKVEDNAAGYVGVDGLYTTSWNSFAAGSVGDNFKVEASTEFGGLSATASYADYEYDNGAEDGHEFDLILGYGLTDSFSVDAIFSDTNYGDGSGDNQALEIIATYTF
jgi:hypothetical protein